MQVLLESAHVEAPAGSESVVSFPSDGGRDASLLRPATLRKGDIHSCLFRVRGSASAQEARLGALVLRWRRRRCGAPCSPGQTSHHCAHSAGTDAMLHDVQPVEGLECHQGGSCCSRLPSATYDGSP